MAPEPAPSKLIDQPWLVEFLTAKGFNRISPTTFGNGRAVLQFDGRALVAVPGDGSKSWRSDLTTVPSDAVRALLDTFLAAPAFLSQAELDRQAGRQRAAGDSLRTISESIRDFPLTHSGQELRRFLWSLYNGHHVLNLWKLKQVLDSRHNEAVTEVLTAWMQGQVPEALLRNALTDSGELDRWDSARLTSEDARRLEDARRTVDELLRSSAPGKPHTHLAGANRLLQEVAERLREAGKSGE